MKKTILTIIVASTTLFACNSSCEKNTKAETQTVSENTNELALKDHVCTADCKPGSCVLAHGEKGHVCTEKCL